MTDQPAGAEPCYDSEFHLEADCEKVWRAVSVDALRETWLPDQKVIEVVRAIPPEEIELLIEEREPPFLRSRVRFGLTSDPVGGTVLSVTHRPIGLPTPIANDNAPMMRAA